MADEFRPASGVDYDYSPGPSSVLILDNGCTPTTSQSAARPLHLESSGLPAICFGTLLDVPLADASQAVFSYAAGLAHLDQVIYLLGSVVFRMGKCVVTAQEQEVAKIEGPTSARLEELYDQFRVQFECLLVVAEGEDGFFRKCADTATVDINVYGEERQAELVGERLATDSLFLQVPSWRQPGAPFQNPQLLELPDVQYSEAEAQATLAWRNEVPTEPLTRTLDDVRPSAQTLPGKTDLIEVIGDFAAHTDLVQAEADPRVRAKLLPHQKQALSFMLTREAGAGHPSLTLWEEISVDDDKKLYQHRITGARSPLPREALSGILADDMGLGKSLSVLAVIAGTLGAAMHHAQSWNQWTAEQLQQKPIPAKSTLILVPSTLLMLSWRDEINRHVQDRALAVFEYHGESRKRDVSLLGQDIVVTTYATLATEFRRKPSRLHSLHWYRVVLDEAHVIRNSSTRQYKAVEALQSQHRWCLTGTPIQNSLDDLSSLIRFLRLPVLEDPLQFRRHIVSKSDRKEADGGADHTNLRSLLETICLRRNKSVLDVPPSQEHRRELAFTREERQAYDMLVARVTEAMALAVHGHRSKEVHQTVLHALLRLRIFCNNASYFGHPEDATLTSFEEIQSLLQQRFGGQDITCYSCQEALLALNWVEDQGTNGRVTGCQQYVCHDCLPEYRRQTRRRNRCPVCSDQHEPFLECRDVKQEGNGPIPSKLIDLVEQVKYFRSSSLGGKGIIFSYWKKSLDIVERVLEGEQIPHHRVDGSLTTAVRSQVLSRFEREPGNSMLLMTFSTGAVGLNNLSVATHVHILEPQWNPSVESQAIGRLVRLGQRHSVQVIRYLMKGTVEKIVEGRQASKLALAQKGFEEGVKSFVKLVLQES